MLTVTLFLLETEQDHKEEQARSVCKRPKHEEKVNLDIFESFRLTSGSFFFIYIYIFGQKLDH